MLETKTTLETIPDSYLLRPCVEVVDVGAVDKAREAARPDAERIADRRESQHDVEVRPHFLDKKVKSILGVFGMAMVGWSVGWYSCDCSKVHRLPGTTQRLSCHDQ